MISGIQAFDTHVLLSLYVMREPALVQVCIWISELGATITVYGIAATAVLLLLLRRHFVYAAGLAISVAASGIGILLSKGLIERPRPAPSYQAYMEVWYSFPSAHAALAATLYGFLAYLAWTFIPSPLYRYAGIFFCTAIVLAVSFSRIYLGVHYMSDVIGGIALGAACAWLGVAFVRRGRA